MPVQVRVPTVFRKFTEGQSTVDAEAGTIEQLIEQLERQYPGLKGQLLTDEGQVHRFVNIYVNDEDARYLQQLETKVDEGDVVSILPSVAGGAPEQAPAR